MAGTRLYEALGDTLAKRLIDECLGVMQSVVQRYGGRVVKPSGDEIMAVLPSADNACLAATDISTRSWPCRWWSTASAPCAWGFTSGPVIEGRRRI